ncbi:hypothetical protein KZX46_01845 (plasmid) [Polymorphobacter sp. PAMC 29334]|uniref:hypothetical protein n=1 Tax=Polymorphobacter sp. PAMC 29334 TaxID=2862331 RepID=UPI001C75998D|nr:hypothetical protein [Polymorphobacter sp. PAMC 29334]QYE33531.1 hypothetical protein KZX46_01845 [Polymorphobacter sp. PAMC 29334]
MPGDVSAAKAGLGTTIVTAHAKQLYATVHVVAAEPGTIVTVNRTTLRLVGGAARDPEV